MIYQKKKELHQDSVDSVQELDSDFAPLSKKIV